MNEVGVWVVYYSDRSGAWVFATEVEALRVAVDKSASCQHVRFGCEVFTGKDSDR